MPAGTAIGTRISFQINLCFSILIIQGLALNSLIHLYNYDV